MLAVVHYYDYESLFMLFSVYLDESGPATNLRRFVVGGMAGRVHGWRRWEKEVELMQKRTGIKRLHAVDLYEEIKKAHPRLNNEQLSEAKDRILKNLATAVAQELEFPIYCAMNESDYESHYLRNGFPKGIVPESPYAICFKFALESTTKTILRQHKEKVRKIFYSIESGGVPAQVLFDAFSDYRNTYASAKEREIIGSTLGIIDNSDKSNRPLFAADLVAHAALRLERSSGGKLRFTRTWSKKAQSIRVKTFRTNLTKTHLTALRRFRIRSAVR